MRKATAALSAAFFLAGTIPTPIFAQDRHDEPFIKHVIVIFNENISFDHYFATYPKAENNPGETPFQASWRTPSANTLANPLNPDKFFLPIKGLNLLGDNPNGPAGSGAAFNGASATNPFRLGPTQAATADQNHAPKPEQTAYDNGKMDQFPGSTGTAGPPPSATAASEAALSKGLTMGYFDGNTVTALWNYAQHFVLFDNTYTSQFGPSSPGAIDLISGQTNGIAANTNVLSSSGALLHTSHEVFDNQGGLTLIGDAEPLGDVCSNTASDNVQMAGKNIGDLLNARGITWGWFQGGFDLQLVNANGTTGCARSTPNVVPGYGGVPQADYVEHHEPFQYYPSTANPTHARPSSVWAIGRTFEADGVTKDPANHQYDTEDFFTALNNGNLPAVSFLKPPSFEDAHPGNSDPIDEQTFLVDTINAVMRSPFWDSTAIFITYDDSDGWYDHQMPPIVDPSFSSYVDVLNAPNVCDAGAQQGHPLTTTPLNGVLGKPVWGRCGYGTRIPMLIISPLVDANVVDHTLTDQSSIIRFVEDTWLNGERIQPGGSFDSIAGDVSHLFHGHGPFPPFFPEGRRLILDPTTGAIAEHR
ncbi:MAG: alkaline phosphatase family protein [Terracidiphilus sp.]